MTFDEQLSELETEAIICAEFKENAEVSLKNILIMGELIRRYRVLKEACETYGDKHFWGLSGSIRNIREFSSIKGWKEGINDLEEFQEKNTMGYAADGPILIYKIAGKRAREALRKVNEPWGEK